MIYKNSKSIYHIILVSALIILISIPYYTWRSWCHWFGDIFVYEYMYGITGVLFLVPYFYCLIFCTWRITTAVWIISCFLNWETRQLPAHSPRYDVPALCCSPCLVATPAQGSPFQIPAIADHNEVANACPVREQIPLMTA